MAEDLLIRFSNLLVEQNKQKLVNGVFFLFDDLLEEGRYTEVNSLLESIEVEKLPSAVMLGIVAITRSYKEDLPSRNKFFDQVLEWTTKFNPDLIKSIERLKE